VKSLTDHSNDCYWPEDLLPEDFPECRILAYGYDSHISRFFSGAANQASIVDHARAFLHSLHDIRGKAADRPIIFIAHSLGGLLLKEALRQSWESCLDLNSVAESTIATIFMGTPHRGSDLASRGLVLEQLAKIIRFDTSDVLLRDLKFDSTMLDILVEGFARVFDAGRFHVFTFRESRNMRIPFISNRKVVSNASSRVGYAEEIVDFINADHRDMCRFAGRFDQGYQKVKGAIKRSLKAHDSSAYADSRRFLGGTNLKLF
jgi:pimeloyl-ACP methyl ester carboxylesterase